MIDITKKEKCSGCSACASVCPQKCISMISDDEGFLYPQIDQDKCGDCKLCQRICPINSISNDDDTKINAYAAINKQIEIRRNSSSGGIFSLLAEEILCKGGIVFGAAFDDDFNVVHKKIEDIRDISKLRGSKYVQSIIGETFNEAERELKNNRLVLFSGTPCQISGLLNFLKKPYDNLLTLDFVCHGVPSPLLWNKYRDYRQQSVKSNLNGVFFRDKEYGWKNYSLRFLFDNDKSYHCKQSQDPYMQIFLKDLCLRPSCYNCKFKTEHRQSDITLADFWGIENILPKMDDDSGTSLVVVNSERGREVFNKLEDKMFVAAVSLENAIKYNSAMIKSAVRPKDRDNFMSDLHRLSFDKLHKKYCKVKLKIKLKVMLVKIRKRIIRSKRK